MSSDDENTRKEKKKEQKLKKLEKLEKLQKLQTLNKLNKIQDSEKITQPENKNMTREIRMMHSRLKKLEMAISERYRNYYRNKNKDNEINNINNNTNTDNDNNKFHNDNIEYISFPSIINNYKSINKNSNVR